MHNTYINIRITEYSCLATKPITSNRKIGGRVDYGVAPVGTHIHTRKVHAWIQFFFLSSLSIWGWRVYVMYTVKTLM